MKDIIFVGAGGFAKEVFGYITADLHHGHLSGVRIKGFLDISEDAYTAMGVESVFLGSEASYTIENDDVFLITVGDVGLRESVAKTLIEKGALFYSFVHSSAYVDSSAQIGKGVVICPFCMVNAQAFIDDFSMLNIYASVAHDSKLGACSVLSPYATLNGNVHAGSKLFMSTRSTALPGVTIGDECVVSAGTIVSKDIGDGVLAFPKARTQYMVQK